MATFQYKALATTGKETKGSIEAVDIEAARAAIKKQGMTILTVRQQTAMNKEISLGGGGKTPSARDLSVMCRQFVAMIEAGVTIIDALMMLGEQTENKRLRDAIITVREDVQKGENLADAFAAHPKIFPMLMVKMTAAGEASGSLEIAMDRIATQFEKSSKTQAMVKKAMIYPIAVVVVAIAVSVVMLVKVIPSYQAMFADLGTDLPAITKFYVAMSNGLRNYWFIIIPVIIAIVVGIKSYSMTYSGKHFFGKIAMNFFITKNMSIKSASSMMARTLSTLLGAGVPLVEAVGIVSGVMTNIWYEEALQRAKEEIMIGMPLSRPLEESGIFPPMVYHMVRIGEESGNTEGMLDKLADYYDEEVEMAVQAMTAAMEPMIIIVLAVVVGGLIAACMAPMLSMYQALDNM